MGNAAVISSLKNISSRYRDMLNSIAEEDFQLTPPIGGWSYSEVYSHIFDASLLAMQPMEDCITGTGQERKTAFAVKVILFIGSLPPGKFKVPEKLVSRVKKISKAEAEAFINEFLLRLQKDEAHIGNASDLIKNKHPRLGYLNAVQWLRFIEIHLKHHLKQLKRIEKSF